MAQRSFSREFYAHRAVQVIISAAGRDGAAVCPDDLAPDLAIEFPEFSSAELTRMICAAAIDAAVAISPKSNALAA